MSVLAAVCVIVGVWLSFFVLAAVLVVRSTRRINQWSAEDRRETHRRLTQ